MTGLLIFVYALLGLVAIKSIKKSNEKNARGSLTELMERLDRQQSSRIAAVLGDTFALMVAVVLWPYFLVRFFKGRRQILLQKENDDAKNKELDRQRSEFPLSALVERVSVSEVEVRENVQDPLGFAPTKPFGFRFSEWCMFLDSMKEGDELWFFERNIPGLHDLWKDHVTGYCIKGDKGVTSQFFVSHKRSGR